MIKPELKGEPYLLDYEVDSLHGYHPNDPENFSLVVELGIGEEGKEGSDN